MIRVEVVDVEVGVVSEPRGGERSLVCRTAYGGAAKSSVVTSAGDTFRIVRLNGSNSVRKWPPHRIGHGC